MLDHELLFLYFFQMTCSNKTVYQPLHVHHGMRKDYACLLSFNRLVFPWDWQWKLMLQVPHGHAAAAAHVDNVLSCINLHIGCAARTPILPVEASQICGAIPRAAMEGALAEVIREATTAGILSVRLVPEHPPPEDPLTLRANFIWSEVEDDSGRVPARVQENPNHMGAIPLRITYNAETDAVTMEGVQQPLDHRAHKVPVNGHNNGITFQVQCTNVCKLVAHTVLWKRSMTHEELTAMVSEVGDGACVRLDGFTPVVPMPEAPIQAAVTFCKLGRGRLTVQHFRVHMPMAAYRAWIKQCAH